MANHFWDILHQVFNTKTEGATQQDGSHAFAQHELREVPIDDIDVNPHQPRKLFNAEDLKELSDSIQAVGLIHPPLVRMREGGSGYELVAGERRWRAAKLAGLTKIPVLVCNQTEQKSAQAALVENMQRVDLNPIEVAYALRKMISDFSLSQDEVAQRISKKRSTVANYLRLLTLPQPIQDSVSAGTISMGHAKVILSLNDEKLQQQLHDKIISANLTVREAEQEVLKVAQKPTKKRSPTLFPNDVHVNVLAEEMQRRLGTRVAIQDKGGKGTITIDYYSLDDLDRLLACLNIQV